MWIALTMFILRCLISGLDPFNTFSFYGLLGYAADAIAVSSVIMVLYEKLIWRYNLFDDTPRLCEYYQGKLISTYKDEMMEIDASLVIKQTFLTVNVILKTNESKSKSINASILKINNEWSLIYNYINEPKATVRDRSNIHYGTTILCIENTNKIEGNYYTDRKTTGTLEFVSKTKEK